MRLTGLPVIYVDLTPARCHGHRRLPRSRASQSMSSFPTAQSMATMNGNLAFSIVGTILIAWGGP